MTKGMALALAKQIDTEPYVDAQELVYIIYDAFESRTCSSCRYFIIGDSGHCDLWACNNKESTLREQWFDLEEGIDCSCNKWIEKE